MTCVIPRTLRIFLPPPSPVARPTHDHPQVEGVGDVLGDEELEPAVVDAVGKVGLGVGAEGEAHRGEGQAAKVSLRTVY